MQKPIDDKLQEQDKKIETIIKDKQAAESYLQELKIQVTAFEKVFNDTLKEKTTPRKVKREARTKLKNSFVPAPKR